MTILERSAWVDVCALDDITPDRGVAAIVGRQQVALFQLATGELFALDNRDPFSGANVLSRGIVGDKGGVPTVASPIYKQRFALESGRCLDDPAVSVNTWPVRVNRGRIQIGVT